MRLIDADDLIAEIKSYEMEYIGSPDDVDRHTAQCEYAIDMIMGAPTIKPKHRNPWERGEEFD